MVDSSFEIVTGYLVPDLISMMELLMKNEDARKLYNDNAEEYGLSLQLKDNELDDIEVFYYEIFDTELDNIMINEKKIFTWKCCSPLVNTKFVIGESVGYYSMDDLNNEMVKLPVVLKINLDPGLKEFEIVTVIIPNACMNCS